MGYGEEAIERVVQAIDDLGVAMTTATDCARAPLEGPNQTDRPTARVQSGLVASACVRPIQITSPPPLSQLIPATIVGRARRWRSQTSCAPVQAFLPSRTWPFRSSSIDSRRQARLRSPGHSSRPVPDLGGFLLDTGHRHDGRVTHPQQPGLPLGLHTTHVGETRPNVSPPRNLRGRGPGLQPPRAAAVTRMPTTRFRCRAPTKQVRL